MDVTFRNAKLEAGKLIIDIPKSFLGSVMHWIKNKKDRDYDLIIKEHREKRSLDANAYAWVLIHKLAKAQFEKPITVYRRAVLDVGDNYTPMCVREHDVDRLRKLWESNGDGWQVIDRGESNIKGCRTIFAYYGSSVFDAAQMSRLIDSIVQDCKAVGIETLTPDKLQLLKEEWQ